MNLRIHLRSKKELGGGTILDLGVYTIQVCQWAFGTPPKSIKATGRLNDDGCDLEMSAELIYGENAVGRIRTSALETLSNRAIITGSKGQITVINCLNFGLQIFSILLTF